MIDNNAAPERLSEDDEIEALLPWYVTGRLEGRERERVADFLNRRADIATHLKLVREENREIYDVNERIAAPSPAALGRLMNSLPAQPRVAAQAAAQAAVRHVSAAAAGARASIAERFSAWVGHMSPGKLAFATAALATVIVVQAAGLGFLAVESGHMPAWSSLRHPAASLPGTYALMTFAPDARMTDVNAFLRQNNALIVDGPGPDGAYRVRLSGDRLAPDTAAALTTKLKQSSNLIRTIAPLK